MKTSLIKIALGIGLCAAYCACADAADSRPTNKQADREISLGELTPTPEMWMYQQEMKLYQDPKFAVRRNAQYRAAQRQTRLAAQKWYGISNSRPTAISTPWMGGAFAPGFAGGYDPNQWSGAAGPTIVVNPDDSNYRTIR